MHPHRVLVGQALLAHEAHKAARAIAALLDLAAIGVVDDVFKVDAVGGRRPHRQDLVGADAKVAVGQKTVVGGAQTQRPLGFVEHHKIVARALHLGKSDSHDRDYLRCGRRRVKAGHRTGLSVSFTPL